MQFTKMHGAGNDYIYVDCFAAPPPPKPADLAHAYQTVGLELVPMASSSSDPLKSRMRMQMFNADGSEAEMCGNGIRCLAKYVYDHGICARDVLRIETGAGVLDLALDVTAGKVERVRVDMGQPILEAGRIPTTLTGNPVVNQEFKIEGQTLQITCVSMGNPHCIVFVEEATDDLVLRLGPKIELDPRFPDRINVEFVEVVSDTVVRQRTWERGSGETWACGTGASAVCVAGVLSGHTSREILIHLRGGDLELHWDESNEHVFMTGPAVEVFRGEWPG